mmetsp:Transcript_12038/g.20338  ORF Transcript_12038/g.20338 Transcript_12038/m.20338 type:complete len:284 (-) Transcript_12038:240-1091(-)
MAVFCTDVTQYLACVGVPQLLADAVGRVAVRRHHEEAHVDSRHAVQVLEAELQPGKCSRNPADALCAVVSIVFFVVVDLLVNQEDPVVHVFMRSWRRWRGWRVLLEVEPPFQEVCINGRRDALVLLYIGEEPRVLAALQPPVIRVHRTGHVGNGAPRAIAMASHITPRLVNAVIPELDRGGIHVGHVQVPLGRAHAGRPCTWHERETCRGARFVICKLRRVADGRDHVHLASSSGQCKMLRASGGDRSRQHHSAHTIGGGGGDEREGGVEHLSWAVVLKLALT